MLLWKLQQCFGPLNTLISKGCSETGSLGHFSKHIFRNQQLPTSINYEDDLYFKMLKVLSISKMEKNLKKVLMVLKIIVFELVAVVPFDYDKNACEQPSTC